MFSINLIVNNRCASFVLIANVNMSVIRLRKKEKVDIDDLVNKQREWCDRFQICNWKSRFNIYFLLNSYEHYNYQQIKLSALTWEKTSFHTFYQPRALAPWQSRCCLPDSTKWNATIERGIRKRDYTWKVFKSQLSACIHAE